MVCYVPPVRHGKSGSSQVSQMTISMGMCPAVAPLRRQGSDGVAIGHTKENEEAEGYSGDGHNRGS